MIELSFNFISSKDHKGETSSWSYPMYGDCDILNVTPRELVDGIFIQIVNELAMAIINEYLIYSIVILRTAILTPYACQYLVY